MNESKTKRKFFDDQQYCAILPSEERIRLAKLAKNGDDEACAKLVFGMTKLILRRAIREYHIPFDQLEDLVQEAHFELFKRFSAWQPANKKIAKFNPELGFNPITYAYPYIEKAIQEHLVQNRSPIVLSKKNSFLVNKTKSFLLSQENLSQDEIEEYINKFVEDKRISLESFLAAFDTYHVSSLDETAGREESERTHLDILPGPQEYSPETHAMNEIKADSLYKIMKKALSEREILILKLRYGSVHGYPLTHKEISEEIGEIEYVNKKTGEITHKALSRERIRQIINSAEAKLKKWMDSHPQDSDTLQKLFINTN
jgi:RNA polymerase sigma factor (sigma-70 family)